MIEEARGNLLQADVEAVVNTVNCVGYMGKGIALQFKQAFPENFKAYQRACKADQIQPGRMFVFETGMMVNPKYIINFPTKRHWRGKSRIEDIEAGLVALVEEVQRLAIRSIAIPPLGCGNGGLDWSDVRPRIEQAMQQLADTKILLFSPQGAPAAKAMPVRTERPSMTPGRALFVKLMQQYLGLAYRLTLLEIQKLAYFLQEAGEPLKLRYESGLYGPFAKNLNHVLERIEGHFIRGYGDSQRPDVEIELLPRAVEEADAYLRDKTDSLERLDRVGEAISGFETPYGMELLASVHWVARHRDPAAVEADQAVRMIHAWNDRKQQMFREDHIHVAWRQLEESGWLSCNP